jgi:hypothetical protein
MSVGGIDEGITPVPASWIQQDTRVECLSSARGSHGTTGAFLSGQPSHEREDVR